jgi:hypothetical protein
MSVGMWDYKMYFYAPSKGVWAYSVRDMVTRNKSQACYNLFLKIKDASDKIPICGTKGAKSSTYYGSLMEISFSADRYILYLNPMGSALGNFTANDLITRAERFQYVCD